jgi:exosortase/archaeosortase
VISPTDAPLYEENLIRKVFIAIEWNSKILEENYNQIANEVVEH